MYTGMSERVADVLWSMLAGAGVRRCYGIVGDALNPVIDGLRRNGQVEFIHVRHEEAGTFAAVAEASLTNAPVAVCGTAGPGVTHLLNGLMDAQREGVPVIAIAGDVVSSLIDTGTLEELNPYATFAVASLYTGRIANPAQTRAVVQTAIRTALGERGPTVIALPGDVAASEAPHDSYRTVLAKRPLLRPDEADLRKLAELIDDAATVTIFGGDGCRDAHDEVVALAERLQAPVGYAFRGKQWLEWGNPNAVGMSGLLGWGGAYQAMHDCELCLLLGTNFPFVDFYPKAPKKVQIDHRAAVVGPSDRPRPRPRRRHQGQRHRAARARRAEDGQAPPRPGARDDREVAQADAPLRHPRPRADAAPPGVPGIDDRRVGQRGCCRVPRHGHGLYMGRALHQREARPADPRLPVVGIDGKRHAQRARDRARVPGTAGDRAVRRRWFHDADG